MGVRTFIILVGFPLVLQAQSQPKDTTLVRTVVVEQQYNPDIMDARRVNVLPKVEELTVTPKDVEYDAAISPATALPEGTIEAYAGKEVQEKALPGYVRAGYGNNGNLDLKANYLFTPSAKDKINLSFGMDGLNAELTPGWDHFYYRTKAGIDYKHQFSGMDFNLGGNFGLSNFNVNVLDQRSKQKFTSGDLLLGIASTNKELPLQYSASTNLMLYSRQHDFIDLSNGSVNETQIETKANIWAPLDEERRIGVSGVMNNYLYNHDLYENITALTLKPYYAMQTEKWKLHAGVDVNMRFGYQKKVQVSPDVTAEYLFSDSYVLYAKATGGRIKHDFRNLEYLNPYAGLTSTQLTDGLEQVNADIGVKGSPLTGLWFHLYGGYQNIKDGVYQDNFSLAELVPQHFQTDADNFYAGASVSYEYKNIFSVLVKGKYSSWESDMETALAFKPELNGLFEVTVRPISNLSVTLGYEYIKYSKVFADRADAVSNLNARVSYYLFNGVSIYARASNLLNKDYYYYAFCPNQGANFLGGLSFRF